MKERLVVIAMLISILSLVFMGCIAEETIRSVREIGATQAVYESKILNLEAQQKYDRKALQDNQTKLEAQVQYFITGGWK